MSLAIFLEQFSDSRANLRQNGTSLIKLPEEGATEILLKGCPMDESPHERENTYHSKIMAAHQTVRNTVEKGASTLTLGPTVRAVAEFEEHGLALPHLPKMRKDRLQRITRELSKRALGGILLFDPVNIRYATDSSNMQVWTMHNLARAAFIAANGTIILWDFIRCNHLTEHLDLITDRRTGGGAYYFVHGDTESTVADKFVHEVADLMKEHGCDHLAIDRMDTSINQALARAHIGVSAGHPIMEHARLIKTPEEIRAMRCTVVACQKAVAAMETALRPGIAEVELWSILHAENIARGGEWIETRLLCGGARTNPWMAEAGSYILQQGDLLGFDTDMVGVYGYCCDMSRTWFVGDGKPSAEQIEIYKIAHEHIIKNTALLVPGTHFDTLTFEGHHPPEPYKPQKYCVKMHGVGMCDEFPAIYYPDEHIPGAFDYVVEPGMVFSVEAYFGKIGGRDGVKLENQVLITSNGPEVLSTYPFDKKLLGLE